MPANCIWPDAKIGPRTVRLPPMAVGILEELPRRADSPWVFPGRDPERLELGITEARLYCNLIWSYLTFLIAEHERLQR